ncbi:MAG: aldo/keto reductase [Clostridiales bacterium]|nr:aldo/keto reductase [Clostridiales bacterium]
MKIKGLNADLAPIMIGTSSALFTDENTPWIPTNLSREEQFSVIDELWDMGLHCFDCAAGYGEGVLGAYLESRKRTEEAVILTKGCHPSPLRKRVTPYDLLSDFHDSLARLKRGYIDIYMLHRDDPDVPVSEIIPVLDRLQKEGKIGIYGASNWSMERVREANRFAMENSMHPFSAVSPHYSLAHQIHDPWGGGVSLTGPEHSQDRKWLIQNQIPVFAYSSMSCGFISGMFKSHDREGARSLLSPPGIKGYYADENFERLARAEQLSEKYNVTVAQISMAWLFCQELQVIPIQGGNNARMYKQTLDAADIRLTESEVKWLNLEE